MIYIYSTWKTSITSIVNSGVCFKSRLPSPLTQSCLFSIVTVIIFSDEFIDLKRLHCNMWNFWKMHTDEGFLHSSGVKIKKIFVVYRKIETVKCTEISTVFAIDLTTNQLFKRWFYDYLKWRNVHLHFKISRHLLSLNLSGFDNKILFSFRFRIHFFQTCLWAKIRYFFNLFHGYKGLVQYKSL